MAAISRATAGSRKPLDVRGEQGPGRAGEQCPERRAGPGPGGSRDDAGPDTRCVTSPALARVAIPAAARCPAPMHDAHVSNRDG